MSRSGSDIVKSPALAPPGFTRQETSEFAKANFLALSSLYAVGMTWVWCGVGFTSGAAHIGLFVVFLLPALAWFGIATLILRHSQWRVPLPSWAASDGLVLLLLAAAVGAALSQYVALGQVPLLTAFGSSDYIEIAKIRQTINYGSPVFNYLSPLLIKVIFPILAIALFVRNRTGFAMLALLLGMAFGASLMQKSFPLYVAIPVAIYLALSRRFAAATLTIAAAGVIVVMMTMIANPSGPPIAPGSQTTSHKNIGAGLAHRLFLTPGEVVANWFDAFPATYPFEHGCGYRLAAPLLGCDFVNNADLMYVHLAPSYVAKGLKGEMNAAHFAEEYANFGAAGLAFATLLATCVILVAAVLTAGLGFEIALAINAPFIITLTSSALHTTLLSGGWAAAIALSLVLLGRNAQQSHR
jgi:hypothetical protein